VNDTDVLVREFLAEGGKIKRCRPGGSENVKLKPLVVQGRVKARVNKERYDSRVLGITRAQFDRDWSTRGKFATPVDVALKKGLVE